MTDNTKEMNEEEDEINTREGYETLELVAETEEDSILESTLEYNLIEAEAAFSSGRYDDNTIAFALGTIVLLKNNILRKYNPNRIEGDSEELKKVKDIADNMQRDPSRYIKALNAYIFPILKSKYKFGLRYKKQQPWQKLQTIKVAISQ